MAFYEFNIATSGLFASQRGLSVTSNNLTNAATPGYSRQYLEQKASKALSTGKFGMLGTGVETTGVERARNSYLDAKLWKQNDSLGEYTVKVEQNSLIESVFGEPSDAGFTSVFDNLFTAIDDLSKLPSETERKFALKQNLIGFTNYYTSATSSLSSYQNDLNFEIKAKVEEVNTLGSRIQSLNRQIYESEKYGQKANTLRDERELCLDRLSQISNIETKSITVKNESGVEHEELVVKFNGQVLVDHLQKRELAVQVRENKLNQEDLDGLYDVVWKDGLSFDMADPNLSGELKGIIDMRDGCGVTNGLDYKGIPYYKHKLDTYVQTFAQSINEIYNKDATGNQIDPPYYIFTYIDPNTGEPTNEIPMKNGKPDYSVITADNISISLDVRDNPNTIRTNFNDDPRNNTNPNQSDNKLLLELSTLKTKGDMFKEGDPKDYMISLFSELGVSTKEATMYQSSQENITNEITNQRLAVSQVDLNEEWMSLTRYQKAYQSSARIISVIDEIYETMIFKLGKF